MVRDADTAAFERMRPRLRGIASRVLGSASEADDVLQDAWIRWQTTDRTEVRDPAAFLATTTTRLAINVSQSARARREAPAGEALVVRIDPRADPAHDAEQREALGLAVGVLLETLSPGERAAYVLREAFDYSYRRVGAALGVSEVNARQLAVRARRSLGAERRRGSDATDRQCLLGAIVAAARAGDLAGLERLLAADMGGAAAEEIAA